MITRKRPRSPSPSERAVSIPHVRRKQGHDDSSPVSATAAQVFDRQEIFLRILSFLDVEHIAGVQGVSRYWSRMSLDPQLWKRLYLSKYPHPHRSQLIYVHPQPSSPHASDHSTTTPSGRRLRPLARLPSRAFPPPSPSPTPSPASRRSPPIADPVPALPPSDLASRPATGAAPSAEVATGNGRSIVPHAPTTRLADLPGRDIRAASSREVGSAGYGEPPGGQSGGRSPNEDTNIVPDAQVGVRNDGLDWKMMLKLGTNWSRGNASSESIIRLPPSPSPSASSSAPPGPVGPTDQLSTGRLRAQIDEIGHSEQRTALSPGFIFTTDPASPFVTVYSTSTSASTSAATFASSMGAQGHDATYLGIIPPPPGWSTPSRPDNAVAVVADQAVSPGLSSARITVFYASGGFAVLRIYRDSDVIHRTGLAPAPTLRWTREALLAPTTRPPRTARRRHTAFIPLQGDPVVIAAMHHPILVTCTAAFHVSVYRLNDDSGPRGDHGATASRPTLLSTFHSDVAYHPAALTLLPTPSRIGVSCRPTSPEIDPQLDLEAALTYCTPVYPSSWTLSVQEFHIANPHAPTRGLALSSADLYGSESGEVMRGECYAVGPDGDTAEEGGSAEVIWPRIIKPVVGVKGRGSGRRAVGVGADGRWCVLAGGDNRIEVYALPAHQTLPRLGTGPDWSLGAEHAEYGTGHHSRGGRGNGLARRGGGGTIQHVQTLLAHSASVTSLALEAGRCVSGGTDGRVLLWDLDALADREYEAGEGEGGAKRGRTVGYVEVRTGREWRGAAGPRKAAQATTTAVSRASEGNVDVHDGGMIPGNNDVEVIDEDTFELPHPQAISSAARSLFLARPPTPERRETKRGTDAEQAGIAHLVFDEEKIVGLIQPGSKLSLSLSDVGEAGVGGGEVMKIWSFSG